MIYTYTAILTPSDDGSKYYAKVPDIAGCCTSGNSIPDAIDMITDALCDCLIVLEDNNITPPQPSEQSFIQHDPDSMLTIIKADTISHRAQTDTKCVRKNVSVPAWMVSLADKRGINCSKVLQDALLHVLS